MLKLRWVGVLLHDPQASYPLEKLRDFLGGHGVGVVALWEENQPATPDLILALGGDGTVLRALSAYPEIPVLAINFGTLGFLTAGEEEDLQPLLLRLLAGDYFIEERLMLHTEFLDRSQEVINEVVIRGTTRMIAVDVEINGQLVHTVYGDGVIIGTPTGSTSYLLSAGASIVSPTVDCMILSGINEFRMSSRSIVLPAESLLRLRINESTREREIFVAHDGRDRHDLGLGDEILVCRSARRARLVFFDRGYFLTNLKERLGW